MKKRRMIENYDLLLLTNPVEWASPTFQSILGYVRTAKNVPSIVVVRETSAFRNHLLIVDGNHRAVAHACLGNPIRFFEIRNRNDIDRILLIEARGGLAEFPHRNFLTGAKGLTALKREAIWASGRKLGFYSVEEVAQTFRTHYAHRLSAQRPKRAHDSKSSLPRRHRVIQRGIAQIIVPENTPLPKGL